MDSETMSHINSEKSQSYTSTPIKRRKSHEEDTNEGLEKKPAKQVHSSVCLEIPQDSRQPSNSSISFSLLSDQQISIVSSDTATNNTPPAAEAQADNIPFPKNPQEETNEGLQQTKTLASVVDDFLLNAAAAPQTISAQQVHSSVCLEIPQDSRQPSNPSISFSLLSDQQISIVSSDTSTNNTPPAAESPADLTSTSCYKLNRKNLHTTLSKTSDNHRVERVQAQESLAVFSKHDVGAMAAVKDMLGLAVAGDSFRLVFELFFGAIDLGIHLDISFICRDLLKMVLSTNQTEKMLLFFYAVIESEQNLWQSDYSAHFRNLCGGKVFFRLRVCRVIGFADLCYSICKLSFENCPSVVFHTSVQWVEFCQQFEQKEPTHSSRSDTLDW
jgi:hypothetical protein